MSYLPLLLRQTQQLSAQSGITPHATYIFIQDPFHSSVPLSPRLLRHTQQLPALRSTMSHATIHIHTYIHLPTYDPFSQQRPPIPS